MVRIQFYSSGISPLNRQGTVAKSFRKVNSSGYDEAHQYKIAITLSGPYGKLER